MHLLRPFLRGTSPLADPSARLGIRPPACGMLLTMICPRNLKIFDQQLRSHSHLLWVENLRTTFFSLWSASVTGKLCGSVDTCEGNNPYQCHHCTHRCTAHRCDRFQIPRVFFTKTWATWPGPLVVRRYQILFPQFMPKFRLRLIY